NKSKGVLITGSKLKAFRNPQPSWGFSVHKKNKIQANNALFRCCKKMALELQQISLITEQGVVRSQKKNTPHILRQCLKQSRLSYC
ncbi:hypothetical protein, partial [Escherichia coli]|uniref:hypothetical protein n=1 Tax=Escherichia coli TaxID=562 RepID=UPI001BC8A0AB